MIETINVLLVDDEKWLLNKICETVEWEQHHMRLLGSCENAMDALNFMLNDMPDLLITDIMMPAMNGLELIKRAKEMNPRLECMILSGYAEFEFAKTAMEYGVRNYLLKPFSKDEFEGALEKCEMDLHIRRKQYIETLEERTELVEYLSKELRQKYENCQKISPEQIENIMSAYGDLSLLRSAIIYLLAFTSECGESDKLKYISSLFDKNSTIYESAAEMLNGVLSEKTNESIMVQTIKEYTLGHYTEKNLNLQKIADTVVHFGAKYVGKCFLQETGYRYSEYLLQVRMEKAKELLVKERNWNIETVAENVGLGHEVQYFYQLFKKYTGMTPTAYRKQTVTKK